MSQQTLTGGTRRIQQSFNTLTPNERKIWNLLNSMGKGMTHDHIKRVMINSGISTFDNRLRSLKKKGWVKTSTDGYTGLILWHAIKQEAQK